MPLQLKDGSFSALPLPENRTDAHRILAELRQTDPVHDDPARQCWMLTRYRLSSGDPQAAHPVFLRSPS